MRGDALMRVLDANGNRAREALRTLEEVARFVLDDGALSGEAKRIRHGLRSALGVIDVSARDTAGDVGTGITTAAEGDRADVSAIATAAGKRLGEAMRQLEEFGKAVAGVDVSAVKALRYAGYALERRLALRLAARSRGRQWRLCLLLTVSACRLPWERVLEESLAAGVDCVQIREKAGAPPFASDAERLAHCVAVVGRVRDFSRGMAGGADRAGVSVVVNDRADVCVACDADGVHVGQGDLPVAAARAVVGQGRLVGVSTHGLADAASALAAGADYCGVGPMFSSGTKVKSEEEVSAAGPGYLRAYVEGCGLPHLAIGGVTAERLPGLVASGARGVAVCGAVCGSENPGLAVHSLLAAGWGSEATGGFGRERG